MSNHLSLKYFRPKAELTLRVCELPLRQSCFALTYALRESKAATVKPWGSHDHVVDGGMIDQSEIDDFRDFLGHDW